jgi:hypothetical protein
VPAFLYGTNARIADGQELRKVYQKVLDLKFDGVYHGPN